jgi:hypothetical protein
LVLENAALRKAADMKHTRTTQHTAEPVVLHFLIRSTTCATISLNNIIKMEERQPHQISVIDTSLPKQNEQHDVVDLENPPADRQRINNDDYISELENEQYADDDATTYTTYTSYITKRSSYRYRWLTVAIVVITIIIIFLSRGAVGGGVNAKNQDVENTIDTAVGSDRGGGGGGGGSSQVVKVDKSEKSKKSKSGKW